MTAIIPKISHLSSRIIRVLGCNPSPMTLQGTNTYIIGTGKRRLLFDAGEKENPEYIRNLLCLLEEQNIQLQSIIISHWHHDHIGGLADILKTVKGGENISILKFPRNEVKEDPIISDLNKFKWLAGNEKFEIEGATVRVLHTPGHSTDHVILELEEENAIFSGDCILGEGTAVFEDLYDYMKSLQVILDRQPQVIYPGHGPVVENPVSRIEFYINHRNEREKQISDIFHELKQVSFSPMELVKMIYTETPEYLHQAAANNVILHLGKLEKEGIIEHVDELKTRWKLSQSHL